MEIIVIIVDVFFLIGFYCSHSASKNLEFDFMDEVEAPTMRVQRPISGPKSTAKKKTASFANVMNAMKKSSRPLQSSKE